MPQSRQEAVTQLLFRSQLGSALMFAPDKWTTQMREPCDLVWICDDVAFLFGLHRSRRESFKRLDAHNMVQLDGALRRWCSGERLRGKNDHQSFDIGFEEVRHHVLVSVVEGPNEGGSWRDLSAPGADRRFDRLACAFTLPYDVLSRLLSKSAGMHTVLDLAIEMRDSDRIWSSDELATWVADRHRLAISSAEKQTGAVQKGEVTEEVRRFLVGTLMLPVVAVSPDEIERHIETSSGKYHLAVRGYEWLDAEGIGGRGGFVEMLNDLTWIEMLELVGQIAAMWKQWKAIEGGIGPIRDCYQLTPRTGAALVVFGQTVRGGPVADAMARSAALRLMKLMSDDDGSGVIGITFGMKVGREPVAATTVQRRTKRSRLSQRLARLHARRTA